MAELLVALFKLERFDEAVRALDAAIAADPDGTRFGIDLYETWTFKAEAFQNLGRDADVFVCDSAAPDDLKIEGHLTPGLAGRYAERAGTRELVLTHFYPECDGYDLVAEASAHFAGKVTLAVDLMCLPVGNQTLAR